MMQINDNVKEKLWTRYFIIIIAFTGTLSISHNLTLTPLPLYAKFVGGSDSVAGLVTAVFSISAVFFRPLFGHLLDHRGRKIILLLGTVIFIVTSLTFSFAYTVGAILLLRILQGIGFSAYTTATGTVVSDIVPNSRLVEGIGYFWMANSIAVAGAPALGLFLAGSAKFNLLFVISFAFGAAGLLCGFLLNYEKKAGRRETVPGTCQTGEEEEARIRKKNAGMAAIIERTAVPASLVMFFIALVIGVIISFLPAYAAYRGIDGIGIYFSLNAVALIIFRPFTGKLTGRFGSNRVLIAGLIFFAVSLLILTFTAELPLFLFVGVLNGIGFGTIQPILNAAMVQMCLPERRGAANATFFSSLDIGIGVGAAMGGIVLQISGYPFLFMLTVLCAVISLITHMAVLKKRLDTFDGTETNSLAEEVLEEV